MKKMLDEGNLEEIKLYQSDSPDPLNGENVTDDTKQRKKKNDERARSLQEYITHYCKTSSLHGPNYIVGDVSLLERLWWIIVLIACLSGCSYMIYEVFDKWTTTPILVSLATQETPIYEVPFPAVTICPETKISQRCLNYTYVSHAIKIGNLSALSAKEIQNYDYMRPLCQASNKNKKTEENESLDDYAAFLSKCRAIDLSLNAYCQWMGNDIDCTEILTPLLTDEGLCYSFNMLDVRDIYSETNKMRYYRAGRRDPDWHPDRGYPKDKLDDTYPRRAFQNGAKNSLIVVFFTNISDIYYSCREFALQGIRVSLHMPAAIPRPSQVFFSVGNNRLTTVAVSPNLMKTSSDVQSFSPDRRNCYFEHERKLKFFKAYSQGNCNLECWTNFTTNYCGCTDFYMPRDNETKICNMSRMNCMEEARAAYPQRILDERLREQNEKNFKFDCNCLPLCSHLAYNSEIATGDWHFANPDDVALDGIRDWYSNFGASAVKIYFKSMFFLPTEKTELYGFTDFVSNIGGVLGLFTGFSLFSLAEIIYFMSIKLIENHRRYGYWAGPRNTQ